MQLCMCSMSRRVPSTSRNSLVAGGLIAFIGLAAAFPFIFASTGPTVSTKVVQIESFETYHNSPSIMFKQHNFQVDSSKPLSGQAAVRGAYINSGSKDIGPDPTRYDRSHGKMRICMSQGAHQLLVPVSLHKQQHNTLHCTFADTC